MWDRRSQADLLKLSSTTPFCGSLTRQFGETSEDGLQRLDRLDSTEINLPPPVSQIACRHTSDIDPNKRVDAGRMEVLASIAAVRAKAAIRSGLPGYTDLQGHILSEVLNSMQITHRTIVTVIRHCDGQPESVDILMFARMQLEGLYNFCLMLESPIFIEDYVKDGWKKQYVAMLLQKEETKALPRFDEFSNLLAPKFLEEGRRFCGITEAERLTIDHEQLGTPLPAGVARQQIATFPTPAGTIKKIAAGGRRVMLERLYPEYAELSSFTHGLPHSNLLKGLLDPRSLRRTLFTEEQAKDTAAKDVTERAFIVSILSIIQCAPEMTVRRPDDIELLAGVTDAWKILSEDSLLGKTIWEIRTKGILGIIV